MVWKELYYVSSGDTFENLPLKDSISVTASAKDAKVKVTSSTFIVDQNQSIDIQLNDLPAYTPEFAAYWAGWMGYSFDLNKTYGDLPLTKIYLAFANYINGKMSTQSRNVRFPAK